MAMLIGCGMVSVGITFAIVGILGKESWTFFNGPHKNTQNDDVLVSVGDFFGSMTWSPLAHEFGIWALILGTFKIVVIAMCFALPLGLMVAIWLSEYAPARARSIIKPALEILAGIPTVVFGFFALVVITPVLKTVFDGIIEFDGYNSLSAGLAVGIMCLPIVTSLSEDALRAVPSALREGAYGMGCSRVEASLRVIVPAALSGIIAAFLLAIARAVGETMIVALAAGSSPERILGTDGQIQFDKIFAINEPTQPMTGYMVQVFTGEASQQSIEYYSSYAVAATLFVITLGLTVLGGMIRRRFRQEYA